MYKHPLLYLSLAACGFMASCKEAGDNQANNARMKDSIFRRYAMVSSITVDVKNNEDVNIVLGSPQLHNSPDEEKQKLADEIGLITVAIYQEGNWLKKGTLAIVKQENDPAAKNDTKQTFDMHLQQSLNNSGK